MRGKLTTRISRSTTCWNIPAHAGKTSARSSPAVDSQEHPRACGENSLCITGALLMTGTSPRMRGKQGGNAGGQATYRNIPAHAGKTMAPPAMETREVEHPRACGENTFPIIYWLAVAGTSPRMRGKPELHEKGVILQRNIPAHAGKTHSSCHGFTDRSEHPRACGENTHRRMLLLSIGGTSPRMRGKPTD